MVVNKYPERDAIRIMFLRESEGVYQFGQKRVYIKIENGDQPYVRIGGGYMHAREFIELYTQSEVRKIDRKANVVNRFQDKIGLQQLASREASRSVERRPISTRSLSPMKSADNLRQPLMSARLRAASKSRARRNQQSTNDSESPEPRMRQARTPIANTRTARFQTAFNKTQAGSKAVWKEVRG